MSEVATIDAVPVEVPETAPETPPATTPESALHVILQAATHPDVDVDKMERLLAMHERLSAQQAEAAFNAALAAAQAEMRPVTTDANNPQTKSKYASYAALDRALRPIYTRHGFALSFDTAAAGEGAVAVLCHVSHESGHTRPYRVVMPVVNTGLKGIANMTMTHATGSAFTYGQRYLLRLIFAVAVSNDDDSNGAGGTISEDQKATIIGLIQEADADLPKFLNYMRVESVDDIPAARYRHAVTLLERKAREAAA